MSFHVIPKWRAVCIIALLIFASQTLVVAQEHGNHSSRVQDLFGSNSAVRGAAKDELLKHPDPALLPDLLAALASASGTIRDDLFEILGQYDDQRKIPVFLALLKPFHWDAEKNVIREQLARLGAPAAEALLAGCKGEAEEYGVWASGAFLSMHEQGVPYLLRAVQSEDACQHQLGQDGLNDMFGEADPESLIRFDIGLAADAAIDPDERIRSAARSWLASWSGKPSDLDFSGVVDALIATYQSKTPPETMVKIARMLSQPGRPRVTRFMRAAVHAPNPEIQQIATQYLSVYGAVGEPASTQKIRQPRTTEQKIAFLEKLGNPREDNDNANAIRYLADPVERVRVSAASTLGRIDAASMNGRDEPGPGSEHAPAGLVKALTDSSPLVRAAAAEALGSIRTNEAQDSLVGALQDNDERVRLAAATALESLPTDAAVSGLSQIYKDPRSSAELKQQAVATLGSICNPASLPVFLEELTTNNVNPPDSVGYGLACVLKKKPDSSAFEPIHKAIEAERPRPQASFIVALGETKSPAAFTVLADLLQSSNSVMQRAAADALGSLGDARAVGPLAKLLTDQEVGISAAAALKELSDFTAPPELLVAVSNPNPTVRLHGTRALARSHDPKAIETLISAMPKEPLAISALGESSSKRAVVALVAFLRNPSNKSTDRAAAATALGELDDLQAVDALILSMNEDNASITMQASSALALLKDKRAIEPLKQAYARWSTGTRENSNSVKGSIAQALFALGVTDFVRQATGMPPN